MKLVPKDWREFQHYKDRSPPWIRLHKKLLDNYEFHCLHVASRALAPMLWLLASESMDGVIDADPSKLAFRLRQTEKDVEAALKPLIAKGFFVVVQDDSNVLAERKQSAVPETEALQRTEAEAEAARARDPLRPPGVTDQVWIDWTALRRSKKAPVTQTAINGAVAEAKKAGMTLDAFLAEWCQRGSQGLKADWLVGRNGSAAAPRQTTEERDREARGLLGFAPENFNA